MINTNLTSSIDETIYNETYKYRGIKYFINIIKRTTFTTPFLSIKYVYILHPPFDLVKITPKFYDIFKEFFLAYTIEVTELEFSSKIMNDKRINKLHEKAKEHIDFLLDNIIFNKLMRDKVTDESLIDIISTLLKSKNVDDELKTNIINYYKNNERNVYLKLLRR